MAREEVEVDLGKAASTAGKSGQNYGTVDDHLTPGPTWRPNFFLFLSEKVDAISQ